MKVLISFFLMYLGFQGKLRVTGQTTLQKTGRGNSHVITVLSPIRKRLLKQKFISSLTLIIKTSADISLLGIVPE